MTNAEAYLDLLKQEMARAAQDQPSNPTALTCSQAVLDAVEMTAAELGAELGLTVTADASPADGTPFVWGWS